MASRSSESESGIGPFSCQPMALDLTAECAMRHTEALEKEAPWHDQVYQVERPDGSIEVRQIISGEPGCFNSRIIRVEPAPQTKVEDGSEI